MNRQREKRSVIHKVGNAAGIVLSGILIFILSMNCILIFKSLTNMEKVPGIGGIIPMIVLTCKQAAKGKEHHHCNHQHNGARDDL